MRPGSVGISRTGWAWTLSRWCGLCSVVVGAAAHLARRQGADVPFFLVGGRVRGKGGAESALWYRAFLEKRFLSAFEGGQ